MTIATSENGSPAPDAPTSPEDNPITPAGDAGLFDVDPEQGDVSQSPDSITSGDVDEFPIDVEP